MKKEERGKEDSSNEEKNTQNTVKQINKQGKMPATVDPVRQKQQHQRQQRGVKQNHPRRKALSHSRNGLDLWPHWCFWAILRSLGIVYLTLLGFFLMHSTDEVRGFLNQMDPTMGIKQPQRSYANDCSLTMDAFLGTMDRFVLAHLLGWLFKMMVIRQWSLVWFLSMQWELIELLTRYFIYNFAECWWDAWIIDVALCNALGIIIGYYLLRYFEMELFEWSELFNPQAIIAQFSHCLSLSRMIGGIPVSSDCDGIRHSTTSASSSASASSNQEYYHSTHLNRNINNMDQRSIFGLFSFTCLMDCFNTTVIILSVCLLDLNAFLLKLFLDVPTEHSLNLYRLLLIGFLCVPATIEWYSVFKPNKHNKPNQLNKVRLDFAWLLAFILAAELSLIVKSAPVLPSMPPLNRQLFAASLVGYFIHCLFMSLPLRKYSNQVRKSNDSVNDDDGNGNSNLASKKED